MLNIHFVLSHRIFLRSHDKVTYVTPEYLCGRVVDRRRMNDLRKEVGMQCSLTGRLVRSRMRWAGHLIRMVASSLAKRAEVDTSKTQENGKALTEMGGLREEGHEKIGRG